MESCTSGLLASMLTDTEGASSIFTGSLVTYSNEQKIKAGVRKEIISEYGVYSAQCAREMAQTVQKIYGTDIGAGITGTTGNVDPNNADSVQGEVYFCICLKEKTFEFHINKAVAGMNRKEIKQFYADEFYKKLFEVLSVSN